MRTLTLDEGKTYEIKCRLLGQEKRINYEQGEYIVYCLENLKDGSIFYSGDLENMKFTDQEQQNDKENKFQEAIKEGTLHLLETNEYLLKQYHLLGKEVTSHLNLLNALVEEVKQLKGNKEN